MVKGCSVSPMMQWFRSMPMTSMTKSENSRWMGMGKSAWSGVSSTRPAWAVTFWIRGTSFCRRAAKNVSQAAVVSPRS